MNEKRVHLMGIGGVGMAGLAVLLKARGVCVSGCDIRETPRTQWLRDQGIDVAIGHSPQHVAHVDEVIVTPAVPEDAPERLAARRVRRRGEVLAELANARETIAVCGSHGKTTTATYIAKLLRALGERVSWCIGGETGAFSVAEEHGGVLVIEADESDGTLALHHAHTLVVTNVEYDHPDHFKTAEDYRACFETARRQAGSVVEGLATNEALAVEVARRRGHAVEAIRAALPQVTAALPDRRFQTIAPGVVIDYAHHPTEIAYTLAHARAVCRGRLRVLFQPHRYSRTRALKDAFAQALSRADEVVLCPTYAAFESPVAGGDVADLYQCCRAAGVCVLLAPNCEAAWTHAENVRQADDMTLVLGAGDIVQRLHRLPPRRIWQGQGTNTWRSDLKLDDTYVRTTGPANAPGATLGIPWMTGIPGTIGGWLKMNAGAFGHSISEVIEAVETDGVWRTRADCGFGYRTSALTGEIRDFRLDAAALARAKRESAADYRARRRAFPPGTYGSFFKNPEGDFAGRLLEAAGVKAFRVGGAYVWAEHANVIVRGEGATASDVLALARLMHEAVYFKFGCLLEPEVQGVDVSF